MGSVFPLHRLRTVQSGRVTVNCRSLDLCTVWCLFNNLPTPDSLGGPEQERKEMVVPRVIHVGASCPRNVGGEKKLCAESL